MCHTCGVVINFRYFSVEGGMKVSKNSSLFFWLTLVSSRCEFLLFFIGTLRVIILFSHRVYNYIALSTQPGPSCVLFLLLSKMFQHSFMHAYVYTLILGGIE